MVSARQLNRATLARQLLLERAPVGVAEAVHRVVAIQAQEPASPYLALWNRVDRFAPADLDAAFAGGSVVKATLMRITLHAVHRDDYTAFHEAMLANLRASRLNDRRFRVTGLTIEQADALLPSLVRLTRKPRTKPEIEAMLAEQLGGPPHQGVWWALKTFAPLVHATTGPPWSFGPRPSFRAAPAKPPRRGAADALARLARRYLEGFGPASAEDFGQFALQRRTAARAAMDALGDEVRRLAGPGGTTLFDIADAALPDQDVPAPARLLPMWDSTLLAYADRSRVLPEEHRPHVIRRNGDVLPAVLVDGFVAGVWRPVEGGIEVTAFRRLAEGDWAGLAGEAAAMLALLERRDPATYRRYGNWWTALPDLEVRVLPG